MLKEKEFLLGWLLSLIGMTWITISFIMLLARDKDFNWWSVLIALIGFVLLTHAILKKSKEEE